MNKIKKIIVSCMFLLPVISNGALEIKIQSSVDTNKTLVMAKIFSDDIETKMTNMLGSLPNINILKETKSCKDVSLRMKSAYYCVDIIELNGVIKSSIYEKNNDQITKTLTFNLSNYKEDTSSLSKTLSNGVYKSIFGKETVFNSKLAYVERKDLSSVSKIFNLKISDYDGTNVKTLLASTQPILSIDWSPDNSKIAYVSYENVRSNVFIYDFKRKTKRKITSFKGINAFPSWSPDGKKLAISLSKDGTSDIYVYNIKTKRINKITAFKYDATEPAWISNDELVFTSNKSGLPYLYKLNIKTKKQKALSKDYKYNTSPKLSKSKEKVYSIYSKKGKSGILETIVFNGKERVVIEDFFAESPSVSKGNEIIIYSTKRGKRGSRDVLRAIDLNGSLIYEIKSPKTNLKEPSYSN